jgi:hypothetical protein
MCEGASHVSPKPDEYSNFWIPKKDIEFGIEAEYDIEIDVEINTENGSEKRY